MPERPAIAAGRFLLSLDDQLALLKDFDGGNIKGEVVTINMGPRQVAQKQISTLKFEPFRISIGMSMGKPLAEWIKASLDLSYVRKAGHLVSVNLENKAQSYRHFRDALIEEITVPAMDASNKAAAFFTIKFQAEEITYAKGDDAVIQGVVNSKQKTWLCSNFRLRIGDLPCARVTKVDSFTITQRIMEKAVGESRVNSRGTTTVEFPNLKVTLSAADAGPWQEWFTEFVIKGNNGQEKERQGSLEFLDPSTRETLGSIDLLQVGIFSLYTDRAEAGADAIARFVVELYVEKMVFNIQGV
jgi:T4-like virus tail tube protein gp19